MDLLRHGLATDQAAKSQQLTTSAITASRVWLLLIAISTLIIAGLIVWLFVHRYVVSRLEELAGSMLADRGAAMLGD